MLPSERTLEGTGPENMGPLLTGWGIREENLGFGILPFQARKFLVDG